MAASVTSVAFEGFSKVAEAIYLYRPADQTNGSSSNTPALIVLCSWMGALPRHIIKYTDAYKKLYPQAAILVIRSGPWDCVASDEKQAPRIRVACEIVASFKKLVDSHSVILHAMSNGGGIAATRMAAMFSEQGKSRMIDKLILDCLPGKFDISQFVTAMAVITLPKNRILHFLGRLLLRAWIWSGYILCSLLRREEDLAKQRRRLNDPTLFHIAAPRLYLYSKADKLIHPLAKEIVYETAAHCALLMEGTEKYLGNIEAFVEGRESATP